MAGISICGMLLDTHEFSRGLRRTHGAVHKPLRVRFGLVLGYLNPRLVFTWASR
jgi:hypothetical protein